MCPIHACVAQPVCVSISRQPTCPQGQALIEVMNAREPKWRRIKLLVRLLGVMDLPQLGWWVNHSLGGGLFPTARLARPCTTGLTTRPGHQPVKRAAPVP